VENIRSGHNDLDQAEDDPDLSGSKLSLTGNALVKIIFGKLNNNITCIVIKDKMIRMPTKRIDREESWFATGSFHHLTKFVVTST